MVAMRKVWRKIERQKSKSSNMPAENATYGRRGWRSFVNSRRNSANYRKRRNKCSLKSERRNLLNRHGEERNFRLAIKSRFLFFFSPKNYQNRTVFPPNDFCTVLCVCARGLSRRACAHTVKTRVDTSA